MSQGTRQETLIRSLIEALCLTLEKYYQGQARQKPKLQAVDAIKASVEKLWKTYPIQLNLREANRVSQAIYWFADEERADPDLTRPHVVIAITMAMADRLKMVAKGAKKPLVARLNQEIQALYDTFDRQTAKTELLIKGAEFADKILAREI
jgi:hypothetical protein